MSYEIPPPLRHKEKIAYGLTLVQLAVALPSFLLILFLIMNLPTNIALVLSFCILIFAAFLMFFEGWSKIRYLYQYIKNQNTEIKRKNFKQSDFTFLSKDCFVLYPLNFITVRLSSWKDV